MSRIALDISAAAGTPPATNPGELDHAMNLLASRLATLAMPPLETAAALEPNHLPTTESLCRLKLACAGAEAALGHLEVAAALGEDAARRAEQFVAAQSPHTAGAYAMLGTVWSSRAEIEHRKEYLSSAVLAWSEAAALDPYGVTFPLRITRALEVLNRHDEARTWAQRTLDRDALQRLDPLKGLTPEERSELTAILGRP